MSLRKWWIACSLVLTTWLAGCAHPVTLAPDLSKIPPAAGGATLSKTAGYVITAQDRDRQVTSAGGGGDQISYYPYRDLEAGIYAALSHVFSNVVRLDSTNDKDAIRAKHVDVIVLPHIETSSSSDGLFTWPPTQFSIKIHCQLLSSSGDSLGWVTAQGDGSATFSEFSSNFSLSAQRASENVLADFVQQLSKSEALHH